MVDTGSLQASQLDAARAAFVSRDWERSRDLFRQADAAATLEPVDLTQLAESEWWSGNPDGHMDAMERAYTAFLSLDEKVLAAGVALQMAIVALGRQATHLAVGWLRRSKRILEHEPPSAAHAWAAMIEVFRALNQGDSVVALKAVEDALELARAVGEHEAEMLLLNLKGRALIRGGEVAAGLELIDESTAAAVAGELSPHTTADVYCSTMDACRDLADWQRAADWTDEAEREMRRQRISGYPGVCRVYRASIKRLRGAWPEAEDEARRACSELERFRMTLYVGWGYNEIGEIQLRRGDLAGAKESFAHALQRGRDPEPGMSLLLLAEGDTTGAARSIQRALSVTDRPAFLDGDSPKEPLGRGHLLPALVRIALANDDLDTARAAATELEGIADTYSSAAFEAEAADARGAIQLAEGDGASAIQTLGRALRIWQAIDAPYETALVREKLSAALGSTGDDGAARLELEAVRTTFERLGAIPDLRRVESKVNRQLAAGRPIGDRQVRTFMFTDIVSSTDLIEVIGDQAWEELIDWHDATLRALVARHGGEEANHTGDGFFVAFGDAPAAIDTAVEIQEALAAHRTKNGFAPSVRIGLHTAEATHTGSTYRGIGVHAAARVGALAGKDEIYASRDTLEAAGTIPFATGEFASVSVKGIKQPIDVAALLWAKAPERATPAG